MQLGKKYPTQRMSQIKHGRGNEASIRQKELTNERLRE